MDGRLPTDTNGRVEPEYTIRERMRKTDRFIRSGRCRNPREREQLIANARASLDRCVREVGEWAVLVKELEG
jgi:hypothetical protein